MGRDGFAADCRTTEIQPVEDKTHPNAPSGRATLFTLHLPAEAGINTSNTFSIPNTGDDHGDEKHESAFIEASARRYASTCLFLSRTIERCFTGAMLIFPFHFFL